VLESLGLGLGQLACFDELVDERLIARHLDELVAAQHVPAAVADLRQEKMVVDEACDGGGSFPYRGERGRPGSVKMRRPAASTA